MSSVVYADFTCPASYLASLHMDEFLAQGRAVPDWRAVEDRPRLPLTGMQLEPPARATRDRELTEIRALAPRPEQLPPRAPGLLPHTGAAVAAYAEAYGAGVADLVRPLLFSAYWVDGMDIGDPEVLRRLLPGAFARGRRTSDAIRDFGYAVTSQRGPITSNAYRRIRDWQQEWLALGATVGLTLVTGSATVSGSVVLEHLSERRPGALPARETPRSHVGASVLANQ